MSLPKSVRLNMISSAGLKINKNVPVIHSVHRSGNRSAAQHIELFVRMNKKAERKESEERDLLLVWPLLLG